MKFVPLVLAAGLFLSVATVQAQEVPEPSDSTMVVTFDRLDDIDPTAKSPRELTFGRVSAVVGGQPCAEHRFTEDTGFLAIGLLDQPEPCHRPDELVTLVNANGQQVGPTFTFEPGTAYRVTNYAPPSPDTVVGTPEPTETDVVPGPAVTGGYAWDATTSAGWRATLSQLSALLTVVALGFVIRKWRAPIR